MKPQFSNLVTTSFLLYLDHMILKKGEAFANTNSYFYPNNQRIAGLYSYSSPFSQIVADGSITGATQEIYSGIYLNNTFITTGQSGYMGANFEKGSVYFNTQIDTKVNKISGNFAIKDFNVGLINIPERKLLFETKFSLKNKVGQIATGIPSDSISYPAIFIKNVGGNYDPLAIGGLDLSKDNIGVFIFADSQFLLDGTISIMKELIRTYVPLLSQDEMPFNIYGNFKNTGIYNYENATINKIPNGSGLFINNVDITKFDYLERATSQNLNPECYFATADFELCYPRLPRSS